MAEIQHELKVHAARPEVLEALTTKASLERWHGAHVIGGPQEWILAYPSGPIFRWKVVEATPERVTWLCEEGPGNTKGSEVSFVLSDTDKARTLIELVHRGRTGRDPNYRKCNTLWGVLLGRLQQEAEGLKVRKR